MSDPAHIVIVDDDCEIRSLLSQYLQKNGFRATAVADATGLDRLFARQQANLVVLDLMLPGEDGLSICRRLRAEERTPVIMLTAKGGELDRIVGLEIGAEDYVTKPFSPRELLVRIRNVLRRCELAPRRLQGRLSPRYRFAGWILDTVSRNLIDADGQPQPLAGAEYRLILALVANANRVLSRNRLMELTKGRDADPLDRSIDVRVSRLRQLLRDDAREPRIIKTVYGEGYVVGTTVEVE